jgi:uncharacterized integral membrane protein (TIGR00697 family)
MKNWIKKELNDFSVLLRNIPAVIMAMFVVAVIMMNLLASKTIVQTDWIALDAGIVISWLSFMSMDVITKHFGPKASTKVSIFATFINLLVCGIFWVVSIIPSTADDYTAFNSIFGGTWFILLGSTIAFIASAFINNFLNWGIGQAFKKDPDGKLAYVTRTYISTATGQFFDNLIFSMIVFMGFAPIFWDGFSWTFIQCLMCSLTGAVIELIFEVIFSPIGYKITQRWKANGVGKEYIDKVGVN